MKAKNFQRQRGRTLCSLADADLDTSETTISAAAARSGSGFASIEQQVLHISAAARSREETRGCVHVLFFTKSKARKVRPLPAKHDVANQGDT